MKHVVIGMRGQIGSCVSMFLKGVGEDRVVGVDVGGVVYRVELDGEVDVDLLHVCIPFVDGESFHEVVSGYMVKYPSKYVIVYSTVLPGTCERLGGHVVHSPVEGRHPNLVGGFRTFKRLVGGECSEVVGGYFRGWGLEVDTYVDAKVTELGKLLSTERYGISILFSLVEDSLCKKYGLRFEDVVLSYQRMYNNGYKKLNEERFTQPLIVPPEGKIGGHCIIPNSKLLSQVATDKWIDELSNYNDKLNETGSKS